MQFTIAPLVEESAPGDPLERLLGLVAEQLKEEVFLLFSIRCKQVTAQRLGHIDIVGDAAGELGKLFSRQEASLSVPA